MAAYAAEHVLFCSVMNESIVFIRIANDADLWDKLYSLAEKLYGEDKPCCPTHTNIENKDLFPKLKLFVTQNTRLLCELPCIKVKPLLACHVRMIFHFVTLLILNIVLICENRCR